MPVWFSHVYCFSGGINVRISINHSFLRTSFNEEYLSICHPQQAVLAEWVGALDSGSLVWEDAGSNPSVPNSSVWDGGQWRDCVSLARVDPALKGYLEKSGEGKQEECVKAQDGRPPAPHCTS